MPKLLLEGGKEVKCFLGNVIGNIFYSGNVKEGGKGSL